MNKFTFCLLLVSAHSFGQSKSSKSAISEDSMIAKWTRASINIECTYDYSTQWDTLIRWRNSGKLTDSAYKMQLLLLNMKAKYSGTAIFLKHNNRHYFLSAKHMLEDIYHRGKLPHKITLVENFSTFSNDTTNIRIDNNGNAFTNKKSDIYFLMNFSNKTRYVLSKQDDVAIMLLDSFEGIRFVKTLYKRGYQPITIKDIDTACNITTGQQIFAVGFPDDAVVKHKDDISPQETFWQSANITLPIVVKGKISNTDNRNKNSFDAEIYSTHGMSGGPVISNNKLVGIVQGADTVLKNLNPPVLSYSIRLTPRFVKSSVILPLLNVLERTSQGK